MADMNDRAARLGARTSSSVPWSWSSGRSRSGRRSRRLRTHRGGVLVVVALRRGLRPEPAGAVRGAGAGLGDLRPAAASPGTPVLTVEFAVAVVAFGCARWGHPRHRAAQRAVDPGGGRGRVLHRHPGLARGLPRALRCSGSSGTTPTGSATRSLVGATILGLLVLAVPWLAGLVLRATARARRSEVRPGAGRGRRRAGPARDRAGPRDRPAPRGAGHGWPATCTTWSATRWR